MKRLYLIRHAKSNKDIPGIKDRDRPLNKRGEKEARDTGKHLKKRGITVQAVYTSPATRALDTARAIARKIGFSRKKIKVVNALYYSNIPKLLKVIKNIDDKAGSAIIFGHNPEFLNLVNYLSGRLTQEFRPCGVFGIDFSVDSWKKVARKKGKIVFSHSPESDL
ncbi:MAG: histidine phosphatase family protein [Candidatus Omnitrophota bacterium]